MTPQVKSMLWCDGCEMNQPIESELAMKKWRYIYIRPRDGFFIATPSAYPADLSMSYIPKHAKLVCCDEGAAKLYSRWLGAGTLDAPRGNVAEPAKLMVFCRRCGSAECPENCPQVPGPASGPRFWRCCGGEFRGGTGPHSQLCPNAQLQLHTLSTTVNA